MRIVSALVATALLALSSGCDSAPPVSVVSSTVQRLVVDTDLDLSDVAALAAVLREPKVDVVAVTLAPNGTGPWDCNTLLRLGHWVLERMSRADVPWPAGGSTPPRVPSPSRPPITRVPRGSGD